MNRLRKALKIVFFFFAIIFILLWTLDGFPFQGTANWLKIKNNPYVSALGHWSEGEMNTEILLANDAISEGVNRDEWGFLLAQNGFKTRESNSCSKFVMGDPEGEMSFVKNYDMCAVNIVGVYGLFTCSYAYVVMAKFENDKLIKAAGTRQVFMC